MIFNIINMVAILGLLAVTYMYMRHTKRMADIMVRDYETKVAPLIDIQVGMKSHSSRGFRIEFKLFNRGFYPVRTERIVLKWWYKNAPKRPYLVSKELHTYLDKDRPISEAVELHDDNFKKQEFPESMQLHGSNLGKIVSASVWLNFYDVRGRRQKSPETILDSVMS